MAENVCQHHDDYRGPDVNANYAVQEASRRLAPFGNVFLVRQYSPAVASSFPDGFFDFVYVDARHDYASVLADLLAFWPKLAKGGIIAGHDFQV